MNLFSKPEPPPPAPDFTFSSTVGLRATWTCAACPAANNTYQVAHVSRVDGIADPIVKLTPPPNWTVYENATYCPIHSIRGARG